MVYVGLYLGIIFLGGVVLIPALYLALHGSLSLPVLIGIVLFANITSDVSWYFMGKVLGYERIASWRFFRRRKKHFNQALRYFEHYSYRLVFFSKFVYGTRIPIQVLCGVNRVPIWQYVLLTGAGSLAWLTFLLSLIYLVRLSAVSLETTTWALQVVMLSLVVVFLLLRYVLHSSITRWLKGSLLTERK